MSIIGSHGSLELFIKPNDAVVSVTEHETSGGTVELVAKQTLNSKQSLKKPNQQKCKVRLWRIIFMLFAICSVDIITFYYMNGIHNEAKTQLISNPSSQCIYELQYLSNPSYVIIPAICFLSTLMLAVSAMNLYCKKHDKVTTIIIYFVAIVIHSILFSYENVLISNMQTHRTTCVSIDIDGQIKIIRYALMVKGILFTLVFLASFIYNLWFKLLSKKRLQTGRCAIAIISILTVTLLILTTFITIDVYVYHGIHVIHAIGAILGLFHIKCNAINDIHTHHLTTTYNANYKAEYKEYMCSTCCPGGICCPAGNGGCCEWNCKKGGFCVVCYAGCGNYPKSLCFSCCGMCSCFCCDPGGCYGAICCSYDFCTWCGCGC